MNVVFENVFGFAFGDLFWEMGNVQTGIKG